MSPYKLFIGTAAIAIIALGGYLYVSSPEPEPEYAVLVDPEPLMLTPADCLSNEKYDPEQKSCVPAEKKCVDPAACAAEGPAAETSTALAAIAAPYESDARIYAEFVADESAEYESFIPIIRYDVAGDDIVTPYVYQVPIELGPRQRATGTHSRVWQFVRSLLPGSYLERLNTYVLGTDGAAGTVATLSRLQTDPGQWTLAIDIEDALDAENEIDPVALSYALIREFGRMVALSEAQIVLSANAASTTCATYHDAYGCAKEHSYINEFGAKFWNESGTTFESDAEGAPYYAELRSFYERRETEFVDPAAVQSVAEDVAASFAAFVLLPKPETERIQDLKVSFFYAYPELATLRELLRNRLAVLLAETQ